MESPFASNNPFIVAEIGKNFIQSEEDKSVDEYISNAIKLIDAAKEAGADAVKFQTHEVEDEQLNIDVTSPHFKGSDRYTWVKRNTEATPIEFWQKVKSHCDNLNMIFFSTPMSRKAAIKLEQFDVPFWKVGSGDVQDYVMLNELIRTKKPIIISTGMVSLSELDEAVGYLSSNGVKLGILYCVSLYPCPHEQFNLATIEMLEEKYPNATIGFSDHSIGHDAVFAALKMGAKIIEKHFSLSRDLWGSDHKVSMTPDEMQRMVNAIRLGEYQEFDHSPFLGSKEKELEGANNPFRPFFNKKLIAGKNLSGGQILQEDAVFAMRPAKEIEGFEANRLNDILGKTIAKNLNKYDAIASDSII
ncbi:MAG: N-acetylneuraminate synthase family protein [Candidatus Peribacteraceae bacterium]|jgi:sialic acid synthase SpsE|nr:N-acetylneuraminate synthase family protein [Candidatus Peribacteraceae bacterium]HCI03631.1 hypothetical protein [Candidatus Peribacteria bacterium]|tara:strand:+ start:684 stop:1760 length:1077 start_codon:yes stop_codon:yes gene_type:complete